MTGYVYFDPAEIERQLRAAREEAVAAARAAASSGEELDAISARDQVFEPLLAITIALTAMTNAGRGPAFIGGTIGNVAANLLLNALGSSPNPRAVMNAYGQTLERAFASAAGETQNGYTIGERMVSGTAGGRA